MIFYHQYACWMLYLPTKARDGIFNLQTWKKKKLIFLLLLYMLYKRFKMELKIQIMMAMMMMMKKNIFRLIENVKQTKKNRSSLELCKRWYSSKHNDDESMSAKIKQKEVVCRLYVCETVDDAFFFFIFFYFFFFCPLFIIAFVLQCDALRQDENFQFQFSLSLSPLGFLFLFSFILFFKKTKFCLQRNIFRLHGEKLLTE